MWPFYLFLTTYIHTIKYIDLKFWEIKYLYDQKKENVSKFFFCNLKNVWQHKRSLEPFI